MVGRLDALDALALEKRHGMIDLSTAALEALVGDESDERLKSLIILRERFVSVLKTPTTPRSLPSQLLQPEFPSSASTFSVAQVVKPRMNGTWMEYQPVHMFLYWTTTITLVSALKLKSCNPSTSRRSLQWCAKMLNGGMDGVSVKRCWVKIRISLICPDPRRQNGQYGTCRQSLSHEGNFHFALECPYSSSHSYPLWKECSMHQWSSMYTNVTTQFSKCHTKGLDWFCSLDHLSIHKSAFSAALGPAHVLQPRQQALTAPKVPLLHMLPCFIDVHRRCHVVCVTSWITDVD